LNSIPVPRIIRLPAGLLEKARCERTRKPSLGSPVPVMVPVTLIAPEELFGLLLLNSTVYPAVLISPLSVEAVAALPAPIRALSESVMVPLMVTLYTRAGTPPPSHGSAARRIRGRS
jgi:hypothetical protein